MSGAIVNLNLAFGAGLFDLESVWFSTILERLMPLHIAGSNLEKMWIDHAIILP